MKLNNLFPLFIYKFLLAWHSEVGNVYKDAESCVGEHIQSACNYTSLEYQKWYKEVHSIFHKEMSFFSKNLKIQTFWGGGEDGSPDRWEVGTWSTLHLASNTLLYAYITLPFGMLQVHFLAAHLWKCDLRFCCQDKIRINLAQPYVLECVCSVHGGSLAVHSSSIWENIMCDFF